MDKNLNKPENFPEYMYSVSIGKNAEVTIVSYVYTETVLANNNVNYNRYRYEPTISSYAGHIMLVDEGKGTDTLEESHSGRVICRKDEISQALDIIKKYHEDKLIKERAQVLQREVKLSKLEEFIERGQQAVDELLTPKCDHEKVYSNHVLCSFPAQHPWICKKCGYEGVDRDSWPEGPSYEELRSKFGKSGSSYLNSTVIGGNKNE